MTLLGQISGIIIKGIYVDLSCERQSNGNGDLEKAKYHQDLDPSKEDWFMKKKKKNKGSFFSFLKM